MGGICSESLGGKISEIKKRDKKQKDSKTEYERIDSNEWTEETRNGFPRKGLEWKVNGNRPRDRQVKGVTNSSEIRVEGSRRV